MNVSEQHWKLDVGRAYVSSGNVLTIVILRRAGGETGVMTIYSTSSSLQHWYVCDKDGTRLGQQFTCYPHRERPMCEYCFVSVNHSRERENVDVKRTHLGLIHYRPLIAVLVTRDGIASLLSRAFFALRLESGSE